MSEPDGINLPNETEQHMPPLNAAVYYYEQDPNEYITRGIVSPVPPPGQRPRIDAAPWATAAGSGARPRIATTMPKNE